MAAQPFIQMKEFEVLLSMRAGRPFTTSFYTFPTKNRKDDLFVHHEVGALVTPFFFHFLYQAMVVGDNLAPAWDRTLSLRQLRLYSPKALHWDSAIFSRYVLCYQANSR
jgi:hypothetical protein